MTHQKFEEHKRFEIINGNFAIAYELAQLHGKNSVSDDSTLRYFIIGNDKAVHCILTNDNTKNMTDYVNLLNS